MSDTSPNSIDHDNAPVYRPLLDRRARQRRGELVERYELDPTADFLLTTPFQPERHTLIVPRLSPGVRERLASVEHDRDERQGGLRRRAVPLFVEHGERDEIPWGLKPLVDQADLCQTGRTAAATSPPPTPLDVSQDQPDPLVLAHLLTHRRLVVKHRPGVTRSRLIAGLVRALPGRRFAIVVSRRRDGGQLVTDLRAGGIDARGFYSGGDFPASPPRVAVGTSAGLTSTAARHTGCSMVVALDAVNFVGSGGVSVRAEEAWLCAHWLGLVPADRVVSPLERDRLTCFFGPAKVEVPAHGQVRRLVVFAQQPITLPAGHGSDRVVMNLAGELADAARRAPGGRFAVVPQALGIPGPVVVLADDERHRGALERVQRPSDRTRVRVVTPAGLAAGVEVGVLVRADGRSGVPPFTDAQLTEPQANRTPLLVVDAAGPDVTVRNRERAYRSEGWVSLAAHRGGFADWERWTHRPLSGQRSVGQTCAN